MRTLKQCLPPGLSESDFTLRSSEEFPEFYQNFYEYTSMDGTVIIEIELHEPKTTGTKISILKHSLGVAEAEEDFEKCIAIKAEINKML